MSVICMGAVWNCGPQDMTEMIILLAIADNADDYGFAFPETETIAAKARCDKRTVYRYLDELEQKQWLRRARKVINGRCNAYFLNLEKLGVSLSLDARRSPVHTALLRKHGDNLSRIFLPKNSGDRETFLGDNPQPRQVTKARAQVTETGGSGDTSSHPNPEPLLPEPSGVEPSTNAEGNPLPPAGVIASAEAAAAWGRFKVRLKEDLKTGEISGGRRNFQRVRPDCDDYDACFCEWWFRGYRNSAHGYIFLTQANDESSTQAGLRKYHGRLARLIRGAFGFSMADTISFSLEPPVEETAADAA